LPEILFKIARQDIDRLFPFAESSDLDVFIRFPFIAAIGYTGYHFPDKRAKVVSFFQNKIQSLINTLDEKEEWTEDFELLTMMIYEGLNLGFTKELKLLAEKAIEKELIDEMFISYEELNKILSGVTPLSEKLEIKSTLEEYRRADKLFKFEPPVNEAPSFFSPPDKPTPFPNEYDRHQFEEPKTFIREGPKIGRNDPCPCGSGKKYKKCCGK